MRTTINPYPGNLQLIGTVVHNFNHVPNAADWHAPINDFGIDTTTNNLYICISNKTNAAVWIAVSPKNPTGIAWHNITASQIAVIDSGYICANDSTQIILTLPAVAAIGSIIYIRGVGLAGWKVAQGAGQTINGNTADTITTTGVAGYIASTKYSDCIDLVCEDTGTTWKACEPNGFIAFF